MLFDLRDRLADKLSVSLHEDDVYLSRMKKRDLLKLCEGIIEELYEKCLIDFTSTAVRYKKQFRARMDEADLRYTIELAVMSFEDRTGVVLAKRLVAYSELVSTIYNILLTDELVSRGA